jgi:hypothetical protein
MGEVDQGVTNNDEKMKLPFDENEIEGYTRWDWQGTLMAITLGLCVAWVLIEYVIGADTLISWFV